MDTLLGCGGHALRHTQPRLGSLHGQAHAPGAMACSRCVACPPGRSGGLQTTSLSLPDLGWSLNAA